MDAAWGWIVTTGPWVGGAAIVGFIAGSILAANRHAAECADCIVRRKQTCKACKDRGRQRDFD